MLPNPKAFVSSHKFVEGINNKIIDMNQHTWDEIREQLRGQLSGHIFRSFVEPVQAGTFDSKKLSLSFPDRFTQENFEKKCSGALREILLRGQLDNIEINYDIREPVQQDLLVYASVPENNPFDPKYTFETFVVGSSNQFAHAACQAVTKQPGRCYNPLFIFGGAGLGKTHLLKAIGLELFHSRKELKVLYLTSETFTNEVIQAIRVDRMREFRDKYRTGCDVLLLDDVHFFAGKERTQEEFFYTFNYLHESRKQIVITSDRYPKDIQGLENRLQTRFEWGLVCDVQPPEMETRIAILKNKADHDQIPLSDSVAQYIASHVTSNIRELEGALHRLEAYASLVGVPISPELAQQTLRDLAPKTKHEITAEAVLKLVALHFGIRTTDIKSDKRIRRLSVPRQICMYLLRKLLVMSYPAIGKFLGGKDHTTVLHAVTKIAGQLKSDTELLNHVATIESLLR
ncbi:MAG: chromosomal replication initiator protein DnaA [Deltaproteobacteria bacterium]|nr:chromosomal replication initiator protein DnaA [Deltaproteobacteria bacterium]